MEKEERQVVIPREEEKQEREACLLYTSQWNAATHNENNPTMAIRTNTNPRQMDLQPEMRNMLMRNGLQAHVALDGSVYGIR